MEGNIEAWEGLFEALMVNRGGGDRRKDRRTDGWKNGHLEVPPCVLQEIGRLGPLPIKYL